MPPRPDRDSGGRRSQARVRGLSVVVVASFVGAGALAVAGVQAARGGAEPALVVDDAVAAVPPPTVAPIVTAAPPDTAAPSGQPDDADDSSSSEVGLGPGFISWRGTF